MHSVMERAQEHNNYNKSQVSYDKYFSPDDFNKHCIESVNSLDNTANLFSGFRPYVNSNCKKSCVYSQDVINSVRALKTSNPLISVIYLMIFSKILFVRLLFPLLTLLINVLQCYCSRYFKIECCDYHIQKKVVRSTFLTFCDV